MDSKRILELAEQAELHCEMDIEMSRCLEPFVALIEAEVRGDAEPVCWIQSATIEKRDSITNGLIWFPKPHHKVPEDEWTPVYTHPAPHVVNWLVDEVLLLIDAIQNWENAVGNIIGRGPKTGIDLAPIKAALAAVRGN